MALRDLVGETSRADRSPEQQALAMLAQEPAFTPEYFEVADAQTLQPLAGYEPGRAVVLCVAAHLDGVRLIDNVVVD